MSRPFTSETARAASLHGWALSPRRIQDRSTADGTERRCSRCRDWWFIDQFERRGRKQGGRLGVCKACRAGRPGRR